jgi:hypothetical protein
VGRDAESMARGQPLCGRKVSRAPGIFEDELAIVHDGEETANLACAAQLIVDPGRDVGAGALEPDFHPLLPRVLVPLRRPRQPESIYPHTA